jgi:hypothetical protein
VGSGTGDLGIKARASWLRDEQVSANQNDLTAHSIGRTKVNHAAHNFTECSM